MLPEVGAAELLVIAAIALIVVGPKDLPILLRKFGKFLGQMRAMANEFRSSFDEMARQSELDELRREVEAMRQAAHEPIGIASDAFGAGPAIREIDSSLADRLTPEPAPAAEATAPPSPDAKPPKPRKPRASRAKAKAQPADPATSEPGA